MTLEKDDLDRLREIFVPRQECGATTDRLEAELSNERTERKLIGQKVDGIMKILFVIATAAVGSFIAAIANLILK